MVLLTKIMEENFSNCFLWELVITVKMISRNVQGLSQVGVLPIQII